MHHHLAQAQLREQQQQGQGQKSTAAAAETPLTAVELLDRFDQHLQLDAGHDHAPLQQQLEVEEEQQG
jgi:hypothetical protein